MATFMKLWRMPVIRRFPLRLSAINSSRRGNDFSLKSNLHIDCNFARYASTSQKTADLRRQQRNTSVPETIDQKLYALDNQVRRWGRLDIENITDIMEKIMKEGKVSEQQSLILLRGCGNHLVKVTPEKRMKLFHEIWEQFAKLGLKPSTNHHNALLRVKLENGEICSPTEFLQEIAKADLKPNKMTYQLLIHVYCKEGNLEGASTILEQMKAEQMSLNETIFNSFIMGHMKANDEAGALAVIEKMKEAKIKPSADTFKNMLLCYAEHGNMESIRQLLVNIEKEDVILLPRHICEASFVLVSHGHSEYMMEMMDCLPKNFGSNHDIINTVFRLISSGFDEEAFKLHERLQRPELGNNDNAVGSINLLRAMVISERPVKKVMKFFNQLKESNTIDKSFHLLGFWAMKFCSADYAKALIDEIKSAAERGVSFISTNGICIYRLCDIISSSSLNSFEGFKTIYSHGVKSLKRLNMNIDVINENLKKFGVDPKIADGCSLLTYLSNGNIDKVIEIIKSGQFVTNIQWLKSNFSVGYRNQNLELEKIIEMLQEITKKDGNWGEFSADVLNTLLRFRRTEQNKEFFENAIANFQSNNIKLNNTYKRRIEQALELIDEKSLMTKLDDLWIGKGESKSLQLPVNELMQMNVANLEKLYEDRLKSNQPTRQIEKWLLSKYCSAGEVEKAKELKQKLDSLDFDYSPELLRQLAFMEAKFNNNPDDAKLYLDELKRKNPQYSSYIGVLFSLCNALAKRGDLTAIINELRVYANQNGSYLKGQNYEFQFAESIEKILESCSECSLEDQTQFVETVFENGYVKEGTYSILKQLVRNVLKRENVADTIKILEFCIDKYNRTPLFVDVFKFILKEQDLESLETVVSLISKSMGLSETLHHLGFTLVRLNKSVEATKVFQVKGITANRGLIKREAEMLSSERKIEELRILCQCTKNMFNVDRDEILFEYIRALALDKDNSQELLDVYSLYEEENVLPRPRTLRYLANVLEGRGEKVPFSVPQLMSGKDKPKNKKTEDLNIKTSDEQEQSAVSYLRENNMPAFFDLCRERKLSTNFIIKALLALLKYKAPSFKDAVFKLSEEGRDDVLVELLDSEFLQGRMKNFVEKRYTTAAIARGNAEDVIKLMEDDLSNLPKFTSTHAFCLMDEKSPGLMEKVESLIMKYYQGGGARIAQVLNQLFNYFVATDNLDKAKKLLEDMPLLQKNIRYLSTITNARENGREDVLLKLKDLLVPYGANKTAPIFGQLIKLSCDEGEVEKAVSYVKEARNLGIEDEKIWVQPLQQLEELCLERSLPLPWPAGTLQSRQEKIKKRQEMSDVSDLSE
ncbi:DgyrCDS5259 [Dimorphilus gyrociliatus]|uniref:DgyrCDS5259 n=1 Tax=Dimorphilus gyrociliatus TaxID=2664684 RepID=A0A7I8VKZ1_9ANNE|nr:DgyrCDS5259 [Dimorphilus gyrociliatus]